MADPWSESPGEQSDAWHLRGQAQQTHHDVDLHTQTKVTVRLPLSNYKYGVPTKEVYELKEGSKVLTTAIQAG